MLRKFNSTNLQSLRPTNPFRTLNSTADFFDTNAIEKAIHTAEKHTSGEIRVHIDEYCDEDVLDRAAFMFSELDMHRTDARNGTLIYIAYLDHKMAILGDVGIHAKVGQDFWDDARATIIAFFQQGKFTEGICAGVAAVGEKLKHHFPYQSTDTNELSNEVTFGGQQRKQ